MTLLNLIIIGNHLILSEQASACKKFLLEIAQILATFGSPSWIRKTREVGHRFLIYPTIS